MGFIETNAVSIVPYASNTANVKIVTFAGAGIDLVKLGVTPGWWFKYTADSSVNIVERVDNSTQVTMVKEIASAHTNIAFSMGNAHTPFNEYPLLGRTSRNPEKELRELLTALDVGVPSGAQVTMNEVAGTADCTIAASIIGKEIPLGATEDTNFRPTLTTAADASMSFFRIVGDIVIRNETVTSEFVTVALEYGTGASPSSWTRINGWVLTAVEPGAGSGPHPFQDNYPKLMKTKGSARLIIREILTGLSNSTQYWFRIGLWSGSAGTSLSLVDGTNGTKRTLTAILYPV